MEIVNATDQDVEYVIRPAHQVTVTLLKHSAVVEWPELPGVCPAGRLTVHTENPLAEHQEAREEAHEALHSLALLIELGCSHVDIRTTDDSKGRAALQALASVDLPMTTDPVDEAPDQE